jgi:4-aminobutyrate aminotransferase / (S)-3-amino-2-methylpropionate transaminase
MAALRQAVRWTSRPLAIPRPRAPQLHRTMASLASAPLHPGEKPFFPDEPENPSLKTEIPGPKSKAAAERLNKIFDTRALNLMTDYHKSYAN